MLPQTLDLVEQVAKENGLTKEQLLEAIQWAKATFLEPIAGASQVFAYQPVTHRVPYELMYDGLYDLTPEHTQ